MPIHSIPRFQHAAHVFRAFGNQRRIGMSEYAEYFWRTVGQFAEKFGISVQAASRHANILKRAGIFESVRRKKEVYFRLAGRWAFKDILEFTKHSTE